MNTITKLLVGLILSISINLYGQEVQQDSLLTKKIKQLEKQKEKIKEQERYYLKQEVKAINAQLDNKKITAAEAETLKKTAAKKHAANIENRVAIISNTIELMKRNKYESDLRNNENDDFSIKIGSQGIHIDVPDKKKKPKYDIRTSNKLLFAIGFNNTIISGQDFSDSPYKLGGSGFVEAGWLWDTRLLKNSHLLRLNYGFSFQWNKLNIKDNNYFVQNNEEVALQEFPLKLKKAKFRVTNLVFPVHLEIGGWEKREYKNRIRFNTYNKFKFGIGGYAGVRLRAQQKLVYQEDGDRVKSKEKRSFNTSSFVYGLSSYVGIGDISLYVKYDLNPLFKNQAIDQNNVSLGLRIDLD